MLLSSLIKQTSLAAPTRVAPKSAVTSPVLKSPPLYPSQTTPSSSGTEENHFAVVDISPGGQSRYIGDAGRINPAFDYMSQPLSGNSSSSPKSPVLPASTPGGGLSGLTRRLPSAPLSFNDTQFNFPLSENGNFFPLRQPPRRRQSEKAPKPTPPSPSNDPLPGKKAPPIPSKSPALIPKGQISSHCELFSRLFKSSSPECCPKTTLKVRPFCFSPHSRFLRHSVFSDLVDQPEEVTQPPVPPRLNEKHLPPLLPTDTLTNLLGNRSPSPRSPSVNPVPFSPSSVSASASSTHQTDGTLYDPSEATVPPRPPKFLLSRNPSSVSNSVVFVQTEEVLKPPPRPPKSFRSGSVTANPSLNLDPRMSADGPTDNIIFDSPPIPPKKTGQHRFN